MSTPRHSPELASILELLARVRRRQRVADALDGLTRLAFPVGLIGLALAIAAARWLDVPTAVAWLALLPVPLVLGWTFLRPRSWRRDVRGIDDHYGLADKLGNALELAAQAPDGGQAAPRRHAIVAALIEDAAGIATTLRAAPVVALRIPRPRRVDGLAVVVLLLSVLASPAAEKERRAAPSKSDPVGLDANSAERTPLPAAEPLRQELRLLRNGEDPSALLASGILEILSELEQGNIDRAEALARLEALDELLRRAEDEFEATIEEDPAILAEAMRRLAEALEQHELTEKAAEALQQGDSDAAEKELAAAFDEAESGDAGNQRAMDQAMRDAQRALGRGKDSKRGTESKLAEAERRLRREQKRKATDPEEQERRLKRQKETVDRLRREHKREQAAKREVNRLRRLSRQSRSRQKGGAKQRRSSQSKLGEGVGNTGRKSTRARRLSAGRDALEEARALVRRAGKTGDNDKRRDEQRRRFTKAARGKKANSGKPSMLVEGQVGDGQPDETLELDQGGEGQADGGEQPGGEDGGSPAQSESVPGEGVGDGSVDPLGDPQQRKVKAVDKKVNAREGRGATRAEIIATASQEGFAAAPYAKVYSDYQSFAQSSLDSETLPPPRRRQVRRYFHMIQPRD